MSPKPPSGSMSDWPRRRRTSVDPSRRTFPSCGLIARLIELLDASVEANVETLLHALRYDIAVQRHRGAGRCCRVRATAGATRRPRQRACPRLPAGPGPDERARVPRTARARCRGGDAVRRARGDHRQRSSSTSTGLASRSSSCTKTNANDGWRTRTASGRCASARFWKDGRSSTSTRPATPSAIRCGGTISPW